MPDNEDLRRLIEACKAGEASAYDRLVDLYGARCYGYFFRLSGCRTTSDDLLGDLFVKLVEKLGTFSGEHFDKWIFTVASNLFRDYLRSRYRRQKVLEEKAVQLAQLQTGDDGENPMLDKLQEKLGRLDAETAEIIMLRFYGQLSFREMSEIRGEPIGTTLSKLHRGLKKLREMMES